MENIPQNLINIINQKEKATTEFKKGENKLPENLFETICAMLNRNGGHIFLGVDDNGKILGVNKEQIIKMKKDFANLCNNPNKIEPTVYLNMYEYLADDKTILYIPVYESSDVHKTNGIVYDRNMDGDYKVTIQARIANIYMRKQNYFIEDKVYPFAEMSDLDSNLIKIVRQRAINNSKGSHLWANLSDEELLRSLDFYAKDLETGKEGLILAAILLFGKDSTILSALPYHKTDAIYRVKNIDRYDDRDDIRTNLIDSYDRLINFVDKHLNDMFYIEDTQRIDVRNKIAREICSNILMHRDFSNPYPAKLIIEKDKMWTENANRPKRIGYIDIKTYSPYPKNPKIARVFKEIGLADELGSGVRNIEKYTKIYTGSKPIFKEDDIFTTTIPLKPVVNTNVPIDDPINDPINDPISLSELDKKILKYIKANQSITRKELVKKVKVSDATIKRRIDILKKNEVIKRVGSNKTGHWKIMK